MTTSGEFEGASGPDEAVVPLRRNRNFRLLWIGQVLSDLGSEFGVLAYPLLVLQLTRSTVIAGIVVTAGSLAAFAVRLPAGSIVDRVDRRRTMVVCDAARAVVLAALSAGTLLHIVAWPVVLVVAVIDRLGDTLFTPASMAALPVIVPSPQLEDAWAATEARQYSAGLGGPALGGLLFSLGAAVPFIGDTISYGISAITSSRMTGSFTSERTAESRTGLWSEAFEGIRAIWHDPLMKAVIVQAPLINFIFSGVVFTVTVSLRSHGTSAFVIGIAQSAIMVGGLLGAIVAPRLQGRYSLQRLLVALTGGGTICFAIAALVIPSPFVAIPIAIPFFVSPMTNAALFATLLRRTPEELRGRVNNALLQLATGLAALAPFVAGILVARLPSSWAMGFFALGLAVSTVLALRLRGLRLAEQGEGSPSL